jgi:hypothetical protein
LLAVARRVLVHNILQTGAYPLKLAETTSIRLDLHLVLSGELGFTAAESTSLRTIITAPALIKLHGRQAFINKFGRKKVNRMTIWEFNFDAVN